MTIRAETVDPGRQEGSIIDNLMIEAGPHVIRRLLDYILLNYPDYFKFTILTAEAEIDQMIIAKAREMCSSSFNTNVASILSEGQNEQVGYDASPGFIDLITLYFYSLSGLRLKPDCLGINLSINVLSFKRK